MNAPGFIVLHGTRPQARAVVNRSGRSPVLVDSEPVTVFANRRQANRIITRTKQVRREIETAVVDVTGFFRDDPALASIFSDEPYTVVPVEILNATGAVKEEWTPETIVAATPAANTAKGEPDFWEKAGIPSGELYPPGHSKNPLVETLRETASRN